MRLMPPLAAFVILITVTAADPSSSIATTPALRISDVRLTFDRELAAFGSGYLETQITGSDENTVVRACVSHRCRRLHRDLRQPTYTAAASLWRIHLRPGQRRLVSISATTPTRRRTATYGPLRLAVRPVPPRRKPPAPVVPCDGVPQSCEFPSP
jgi:hypothetical protein